MKFNEMKIIYNGKQYDKFDYQKFVDKNIINYNNKSKCIVMMKRTPGLLFAICMLLENGITYIPIDPTYPKERIQYIIENSGADSIITDEDDGYVILNNTNDVMRSDNIAYILFTSGSTGTPKGVEVTREGLINFMDGISKIIDFSPGKRIACLTTVSFDIFFLESIMALYEGLTVILASDDEQRNPKLISRLIEDNDVDMIQMTPSKMQQLLNYDKELTCLKEVKEIMVGGESLSINLLNVLQQKTNGKIYNMYSPTESTIWCTISDLTDKKVVDIGKPIVNTHIYILDEENNLILNGNKGEICIGGIGLARGYLNMPKLTNEKFVPNPFIPGERMYKTCDYGKWLPDGNIEYWGRMDEQVKIRGCRIELGEIESVLLKHESIKQAVVTTWQGKKNGDYLCVYFVSNEEISPEKLCQHLGSFLPEYMIPSLYIRLDDIPKTQNGKIDRKSLIDPESTVILGTQQNKAEREEIKSNISDVGNKIKEIIIDNLEVPFSVENINENSILDDLRINSITFIKIVATIETEFDTEFENEYLLANKFSTIQSLVSYVEKIRKKEGGW